MGKKFLLKIDSMSLKYLFEQLDLNARKSRWFSFLSEYHFELNHIKGKENKIDDALSRRAHMVYEVKLSQSSAYLHERIREVNRLDPFYVEIVKKVEEGKLFQQQKEYKVDESGLLWSKNRLYVVEGGELRSSILMEFHQALYFGHSIYQNMISAVNKRFFFPKLKADIAMFIAKFQ